MDNLPNNKEVFSSAILLSSKNQIHQIENEIDNIFSDYSFYPEGDWNIYGCSAPDGYQVHGAWRHPNLKSYAFLLSNPARDDCFSNMQLIVYILAERDEKIKIVSKLTKLKSKYLFKDVFLDDRIERIHKLKSPAFFITILGIFTAIINAFNIYLMKIPTPIVNNIFILTLYNFLIYIFHIIAILFLINFSLICMVFLIKYAVLILKKV